MRLRAGNQTLRLMPPVERYFLMMENFMKLVIVGFKAILRKL